ncbi:MAG: hypothetical protein WBV69_17290 [Candidatus Sulfotelmatobacter sp.]
MLDFIQRETALARSLHDREPSQYSMVVTPLAANPPGGNKNSNLLIVADCGRANSR